MKKELTLVKDQKVILPNQDIEGLIISKDDKNLTIEYNGNLNLTLGGSINLVINGEVNLLANGPVHIDAPKTDELNHLITLNSRLNKNICDLPSSIAFREKQAARSKKIYDQVNLLLAESGSSIDQIIQKTEEE